MRGNTTRQIVQMLRDAGAAEIHMRISAPPIKHPCHYGIDMSTREEMIAHGRTTEEVAAELGCDSLHYLSLDGVYEAIRGTRATHCDACFSGEYPLAGTDDANGKYALEGPDSSGDPAAGQGLSATSARPTAKGRLDRRISLEQVHPLSGGFGSGKSNRGDPRGPGGGVVAIVVWAPDDHG